VRCGAGWAGAPHLCTVYVNSRALALNPGSIRGETIRGIPTLFERGHAESENDFVTRLMALTGRERLGSHPERFMDWEPPILLLAEAGDKRRIGVWAVGTLATDTGGWRSINRVGLPMIHPLFTQYNEDLGNRLNAGRPADAFATYGAAVAKAIAGRRFRKWNSGRSSGIWDKVAHRFFPDILPYEVGTPAVFGFAEWNSRSLTDNAPDVMFSIAANTPFVSGSERIRSPRAVEDVSVRSCCS
jgi:hypothetical protein